MKRVLLFTLIFACLVVVAAAQTRTAKAAAPNQAAIQALYQKARAAEAAKDYATAATHYEEILKLDASLHPLRANLGLMRYLNAEYELAAKTLRQALAGDGTLQAAQLFLGMSLLELNQPLAAITPLESAVRSKPQDANARFQLARAYYLGERHSSALKELQALLEKQPNDAETLFLLGRVHLKLSLAAYDQLKEKHPDNYRIYQLLGENYALQSQYGPAIANYNKAIERNPQGRGLRLKLGEALQSAGETDKALAAFLDELRLNPNDGYAHYRAGNLLIEQTKFDEALPHLKRATELDPRSAEAFTAYGRCLLEKNEPQSAVAPLRQAVTLDAQSETAWFQLARALQQTNDRAGAQQALQMYEKLKGK